MPRISHKMRAIASGSFLGVILVLVASAQLLGQPLAPTQWHRIRTPHVDIIFRGNMSREAQRMANTLEYLYASMFHPLGIKNKRIALILNNKTVEKNGLTQLFPYKVGFNTFPTQDYNLIGSNDWLSMLATHEFRHAAQYATLQRNFNRLAYILGGELFVGGLSMINVPLWLFEGDAVDRETELTASGRGRIPYFFLQYKTNLLTHKVCGYDKQQWGSFKHPMPNHYRIGYLLAKHLRSRYGDTILADIFQKTTLPMPLLVAVKKITGRSIVQIYEDMNHNLKEHWQQQIEGLKLTKTTRLNPRSCADYIDYTYPRVDKKGHVIVLMSGIGTVTQFVGLDSQQRVREIFTPGDIDTKVSFSIAQNKIVWIEEIPDSRWENRSYGVIQSYNTQTKRLKTLTHKSRYGAAALSPDATKIIAFESDEGYNHQLVILDAENGQVLQRLPNPDNHFYLTPKWSADGRHIVVVKNVQQRVTIARINAATGEAQDLLPYSTEHLGCPVMQGQYVLYNSAYSGIDNIYAIDIASHQRYQVTSSQYGAYHPSISADGQWLLFNNFTEDGMDAVKIPFTPQQWTPLAQVERRSAHAYAPSVAQEDNSDGWAHVPHRTYAVERYRPWQHALNVHSWLSLRRIALNTNDSQQFSKRLQQVELDVISSTDVLNTTELKVNYLHDFQEKWGKASVTINYKDWYPIISLTGAMQGNYQEKLTYTRLLALQLKTPWTLKHGQYTYKPSLATTSTLHNDANITWYTQTYEGSFSRHAKKSFRDICSPWAQEFAVAYEHTPYGEDESVLASSVKLHTNLYFPGLAKHHAFRVCLRREYTYATQELNEATIKKQLRRRPLNWCPYASKQCKESISASVRYALPICYPDWSISHFLYVKRLRAETGYCFECDSRTKNTDHVCDSLSHNSNGKFSMRKHLEKSEKTAQYKNTITLAIVADLHLFTLLNLPQLSLGVQYSYCMGQPAGEFHAILGMGVKF